MKTGLERNYAILILGISQCYPQESSSKKIGVDFNLGIRFL
jgi:hypothetical protein